MSAQMKGLIGTVLGVLSLFPFILFDLFRIRDNSTLMLSAFVFAVIAFVLGRQARNGGAKILGMIAITLGVIGIASKVLVVLQSLMWANPFV